MQSPYLAISNKRFKVIKLLGAHINHLVQRQQGTGIIGVLIKVPAIMEHILGTPFIGKVFQQIINKRQRLIRWNHRAPLYLRLQATNNRR